MHPMPNVCAVAALATVLLVPATVFGQAGRGAPPSTPRAAATTDLTGYWVSVVTEDWLYRMVTPAKGDRRNVPLNAAGIAATNAWDPAKDEADGAQCKAYGAVGAMRQPGRLHITWADDNTLKVETEAGTQTRLLRFAGLGGQVTFNNNQVTLDWQFLRFPGTFTSPLVPIAFFPVAILTLDHLSLASNQFALRLRFPALPAGQSLAGYVWSTSPPRPDLFIGHVLAGGATVCAVRNRFSENQGNILSGVFRSTVTLSMFSGAELMNLTAFNQSSHVVTPYKWSPVFGRDDPYTIDLDNQVLFPVDVGEVTPIADRVRELFQILWQP